MKTINKLFCLTLIITLFACSGETEVHENVDSSQDTSIVANSALDTLSNDSDSVSVNCLDIKFIEGLEASWKSSYKDNRLALKGFVYDSDRDSGDARIKVFKNHSFGSELILSISTYPDGSTNFAIKYVLTDEEYLRCFVNSLDSLVYKETIKGSKYKKRGLGSYAHKTIEIDNLEDSGWTIEYNHSIGKELSVSIQLPEDSLI